MRKGLMKMMVVAGAAALIIPAAAMAEWDQAEKHANQVDHGAMINVDTTDTVIGDFAYGDESPIGYDVYGNGTAYLNTSNPFSKQGQAPWNTMPCPIQMADGTNPLDDNLGPFSFTTGMGNCPAQVQAAGWVMGQTNYGWKEGDNEMYGVILDDLYQSLDETASTASNENGEKAFKKTSQLLDILFYRSNTVGEVYGLDGWTAENGTIWYGGLGIDQTLDQDVADLEGTIGNALGTPHGTWLWNYDHVAQTFYQDFRLFDLGNTFGGVGDVDGSGDVNYPGADYVNLATASKATKGDHNPRTRHGIELLALCHGAGDCTYDTEGLWGVKTLDTEDFAFFDQWVIQSLRDSYGQNYNQTYAPSTVVSWTGYAKLEQSYSSWMSQGAPDQVCNFVNSESITDGVCRYTYEKDNHGVVKSIADHGSSHQTGDP